MDQVCSLLKSKFTAESEFVDSQIVQKFDLFDENLDVPGKIEQQCRDPVVLTLTNEQWIRIFD